MLKAIWFILGTLAFSVRMLFVSAGCIVATGLIFDWTVPLNWRLGVVFSLVFLAYVVAALIEWLAGKFVFEDAK